MHFTNGTKHVLLEAVHLLESTTFVYLCVNQRETSSGHSCVFTGFFQIRSTTRSRDERHLMLNLSLIQSNHDRHPNFHFMLVRFGPRPDVLSPISIAAPCGYNSVHEARPVPQLQIDDQQTTNKGMKTVEQCGTKDATRGS